MQKNNFIEISISLFLIILSLFIPDKKRVETIGLRLHLPPVIANLQGVNLPLTSEEKLFTEETGSKILKSKYERFTVNLTSADNPKFLHSPRTCYEANGYVVYNEEILSLNSMLKIAEMTVMKNKNKETVYYWFFNDRMKTPYFSDVFMASVRGENKWNLVSVAFCSEEGNTEEFIIQVDRSLTESFH